MSGRGHSLDGRVAIVTGAGQGVGEGIARRLAQHGAIVVIAARRAETGEPVASAVRSLSGTVGISRRSGTCRCAAIRLPACEPVASGTRRCVTPCTTPMSWPTEVA